MLEHHVRAWLGVYPNFFYGGKWFSKDRYGLMSDRVTGAPIPFVRDQHPRVAVDVNEVDESETADPVDWDQLQPAYIKARDHLERNFQTGIYGMGARALTALGINAEI